MNDLQLWLVNLTGEQSLWIIELFVIVLAALSLGYIPNKVIDRLELRTKKTQTVWDDAFIACFITAPFTEQTVFKRTDDRVF